MLWPRLFVLHIGACVAAEGGRTEEIDEHVFDGFSQLINYTAQVKLLYSQFWSHIQLSQFFLLEVGLLTFFAYLWCPEQYNSLFSQS